MVPLILEERLTYLFLVVDAPSLRLELGIMLSVPVCLQVLGVPGWTIHRRSLTRRAVRVHLLFVQHLHFLSLTLIAALRLRVLPCHQILLHVALLCQATALLDPCGIVSGALTHLVAGLDVVHLSSLDVLRNACARLVLLV